MRPGGHQKKGLERETHLLLQLTHSNWQQMIPLTWRKQLLQVPKIADLRKEKHSRFAGESQAAAPECQDHWSVQNSCTVRNRILEMAGPLMWTRRSRRKSVWGQRRHSWIFLLCWLCRSFQSISNCFCYLNLCDPHHQASKLKKRDCHIRQQIFLFHLLNLF